MIRPTSSAAAFGLLPDGLRGALLEEYRSIVQNFLERKWRPSELSGGRFCEIVYTILDGYRQGQYPVSPSKPQDFVSACRRLEQHTNVPRSFQVLIPRVLPALYEIRSNRNVGHVGGEVDPNHMDSVAVLSIANWVMAELVRVLHNLPMKDAQAVVDAIAERRTPIVWETGEVKRVLDPKMKLRDQILVLVSSAPGTVPTDDLFKWTECPERWYFNKLLRKLHSSRMIEISKDGGTVSILPPGSMHVEDKVLPHYV